jgi:hypothetical protein
MLAWVSQKKQRMVVDLNIGKHVEKQVVGTIWDLRRVELISFGTSPI